METSKLAAIVFVVLCLVYLLTPNSKKKMNHKLLASLMLPIMTSVLESPFNNYDRQIPLPKVNKPNNDLLRKLEQQRHKKKHR